MSQDVVSKNSLSDFGADAPEPYDRDKVARELTDLEAEIAAIEDPTARDAARAGLGRSGARRLVEAVIGNSPYLTRALLRHASYLPELLEVPPGEAFDRLVETMRHDGASAGDQAALMKVLRIAKARTALLVAFADISGAWTLDEVTGALTCFADAAVQATTDWLLREAARKNRIDLDEDEVSGAPSGLAILGMGKYGAGELNYSSDIDLVVMYEPGVLPLKQGLEPSDFFVRLTKALVKVLQERTEDGYVFRTDLRLRPDPGGTPVAVSLPAAEVYYESRGQNWERAAFIKARAVAGDTDAGARFLEVLAPFIWRKNLDFAAIEDIHSMKRQIHAVGGHARIAIAGHNIKLGRGGIREIEFFTQTQQLIAGGRDPDLRGRQTCSMLDMLAAKEWIAQSAADELKTVYRFLRRLEHRLQMIADDQTHSLPSTPEGLDHIACFMGFPDTDSFTDVLAGHLRIVQTHYAALFETAPPLAEETGNLVFTGTDDDPDTVETLAKLGFNQASDMSAAIRAWHTGRFAATRSPRSRERLTALMPALLRALSRTSDPDAAFVRFDRFLAGLPTGVQLFSLLYANPELLDLLADICGTAPRLARHLSRSPRVLEAVLDPGFFADLPTHDALRESLATVLAPARDYQDALDFARVWAREHRFQVGVRVLSDSADAEEAGPAYSAIAAALIAALEPFARRQVEERHGRISGGGLAIVGMGKLGSGEMSAESDLDLIMIYDVADLDAQSDGAKPVYAPQYFGRVCQQIINALTSPTAEGPLYQVDMRLRPSGRAGPIATQLERFVSYQTTEAWTWEHMALTRARLIAGPEPVRRAVAEAIHGILRRPRDREKTAADVSDMRARIEREYPSADPWQLKHVRGGLIDIEFIAQYLQLVHAHAYPDILNVRTRESLRAAGRLGLIPEERAGELIAALDLTLNLTQIVRVCVEETFDPAQATDGLKSLLARAGEAPGFAALEAELIDTQQRVRRAFAEIIGGAAGAGGTLASS